MNTGACGEEPCKKCRGFGRGKTCEYLKLAVDDHDGNESLCVRLVLGNLNGFLLEFLGFSMDRSGR